MTTEIKPGERAYCGSSTCHGHGDYAVCGKPYYGGIYQCSSCRMKSLQAVLQQRNGECDRLVKEQQDLVMLVKVLARSLKKYNHGSDLAKRATDYLTKNGFISAADCLRGESIGNSEQLDTAPAQFEALAGNSPATPDSSDADHVAAVLEYIGGFEPADIDGDSVELRFEIDGVDTGADVSITEYAARGAAIICQLSKGGKL